MGKTLKRQRQKQLREQQQQQLQHPTHRPSKLPRLANGAPLNSGSSSSKFTAAVSAALQDKKWLDAVTVLEAMQQYGKVPRLGAVQRWVRDADQAGSVPVTARLLDAILRCTVPPPASPPAPAEAPLKGSVVRHKPWKPQAAVAAAAAAPATPAAAANSAAAGASTADGTGGEASQQQQQQHSLANGHDVEQQQQQQQEQQQQEQQQKPQQPEEQQQPSTDDYKPAAAAAADDDDDDGDGDALSAPLSAGQLRQLLYEVPFKAGSGGPDAIYAFPPNTIKFDPTHPTPTALPVPFVPGALLLQGVLSAAECNQIIAAAEAIGWHSNVDYTFGGAAGDDGGRQQQEQHTPAVTPAAAAAAAADAADAAAAASTAATGPAAASTADTDAAGEPGKADATDSVTADTTDPATDQAAAAAAAAAADQAAAAAAAAAEAAAAKAGSAARGLAAGLGGVPEGTPAAGCVWLADNSVLQPLYDRVGKLLPQEIEGGAYAGINARFRLYRYTPGAVYRPHVDGAWPGSGVDAATGEYIFDAFGDRWSRLTFLVYLNDGFEGGCTTYYTPNEQQVGVLDARGVVPVQGNIMVFPHGGTQGSLVHEGSAVLKGAKYVIRTDVLYMNPPKASSDARAPQGKGRVGAAAGGKAAAHIGRARQ